MFTVNFLPLDDFLGLSPDEVNRLLYQPFEETSDIVVLNNTFREELLNHVPVIQDARLLISRIGESGELKATQKGNLPLKLVQELHKIQCRRDYEEEWHVGSEEEAPLIQLLRYVVTSCGWIKFRDKKFYLTKKGEKLRDKNFSPQDYHQLMQFWLRKLNWGYLDRYDPCPIVQHAFLFSLYALSQKASDFVEAQTLGELFLRAFPAAVDEVKPHPYYQDKPEQIVSNIYCLRFIEGFCLYFDLLQTKEKRAALLRKAPLEVKTTQLFHAAFQWKVSEKRQRVFIDSVNSEHLH